MVVPRIVVNEVHPRADRHQRDGGDELHLFLVDGGLGVQRRFGQHRFVGGQHNNNRIRHGLTILVDHRHHQVTRMGGGGGKGQQCESLFQKCFFHGSL